MHTVPGLFDQLVALYAEGEAAMEEGRLEEAIAAFDEGISLDDHFRQRYVTMYAQRAFAKHRHGDYAGALADYTLALTMGEPTNNRAQYEFHSGMCLAALDRAEDAVEAYARSIRLFADPPGPFHLGGKVLCMALDRPADALRWFDEFLLRADHSEVRQLRGWCLLQLGRAAEAVPDLERARDASGEPWTHYLLAWAAAVTGDVSGCLTAMRDTLAGDPSYRPYFLEHDDYAAARQDPTFPEFVGEG
jgi:tetratricopeptide (TPR) repeat protein